MRLPFHWWVQSARKPGTVLGNTLRWKAAGVFEDVRSKLSVLNQRFNVRSLPLSAMSLRFPL